MADGAERPLILDMVGGGEAQDVAGGERRQRLLPLEECDGFVDRCDAFLRANREAVGIAEGVAVVEGAVLAQAAGSVRARLMWRSTARATSRSRGSGEEAGGRISMARAIRTAFMAPS